MCNSIQDEIVNQSQPTFNGTCIFLCKDCKNYKGSCMCEKDVFIAFEGANISTCIYYEWGKKCPHCGRIV